MPVDPNRVRDLFLAATELPAVEHPAYLAESCGPDAELRAAVERLLGAHSDPASLLEPPVSPLPPTGAHAPQPDTGTILAGRYKLLELIDEGGMGEVWVAQQTEPIKRTVAIKLIKPGMDSKTVLARFEAERQALALMDHPNIAKVLDAGATPDGRPFFVMELVKGVTITEFCDARKLSPRERLKLFVQVCNAIQHAHQKGVIHRDIKPSNVLVALYDDRAVPKVIDFGVAKATGQPLTEQTLHTGFGTVVGTPEYMSPEQATFNNLDVDTRSDLYSLGVLLYELLTGTTPVDKKSLGKAALIEVLRIVREVEAPRPSARLSTMDTLPSIAANRSTEPALLSRLLKRELDWVVLKAMEKDRTRRYESANAFAADLERYLEGEAVQAHPPSSAYRLRKFTRKNRAAMITAAAFVGLLIGAATVSSWLAVIAMRAEGVAEERRIDTETNLAKVNESVKLYVNAVEQALRSKMDAEILAAGLQIDLDLATLRDDPRVGLLRLARPRTKEFERIELNHPSITGGSISLRYANNPRHRELREFLTAAVLFTGQDFARLLPPITHDGHEMLGFWHSPDYRTLLTLGADGTARTWETRTGRQIAILRKGNEHVVNCGMSGDGKAAFTEDETGVARFWEPDGKCRSETPPRSNAYKDVLLKDGVETLAPLDPRSDGAMIARNRFLARGLLVEQKPGDPKQSAQKLISFAELWDTTTGQPIARWTSREKFDIRSFSLQGNGRWLTANESRDTVVVFAADDGKLAGRLTALAGEQECHIEASPGGRKFVKRSYVTDGESYSIWDTDSWPAGPPLLIAADLRYPGASEWSRLTVGGPHISKVADLRYPVHFLTDELVGLENDPGVLPRYRGVLRLGEAVTAIDFGSNICIPSGDCLLTDGGKVFDVKTGLRLVAPAGHKYHPTLTRFAADGRFIVTMDSVIDMLTEKSFPNTQSEFSLYGYQPGFGFLMAEFRDANDVKVRLLPTAVLKDIPPDLLEMWIKVVLRGELGSDGAFVKWDEPTWEKKRQELAAKKAPIADFPFPGHVATDRLHWLRAEFEAANDADKPRLAKQLLDRAEAAGDKFEANRWRKWLKASSKQADPPKK